jgi:DNA-binding PadR family transcriptional regulator
MWHNCGSWNTDAKHTHGRSSEFRGFWWGFPGGPRHRPGGRRGRRRFDQGDLKYVILGLLAEKPRHGYDVIKDLEEKFGGSYSPSAGTVYPTLALLEDMGFATVSPEDGGRRVYTITDEGLKYLEENKSVVEELFERISSFGEEFMGEATRELGGAIADLARATFQTAPRSLRDPKVATKVRDILRSAAREIEDVLREPAKPAAG